ncbi:TRAP transporter small permease [uncultured Mailhella sp.]|uniref:TRAP transporter small permease n=1 Tax=uncultured Mailhella sp. TaxID=1981031 RepID=UPI00261473B6|nr:TRAP transporter small permease [uncultured Mailhella sp.]
MYSFLRKLSIYSSSFCGWLLAILMVIIFFDIVMRTIDHPILGVAELSMIIMLTTVYLGLANCEQNHGHIAVDFIQEIIPKKIVKVFNIMCGILCVGTLVVSTYFMFINTVDSYVGDEAMAGLVPIVIWPVKAIITFGLLLYTIQSFINLLVVMSFIKPNEDSE